MTDEDITQVKQIEVECLLSPWSLKDYEAEIIRRHSLTFVARKSGAVVGFIVGRLFIGLAKYDLSENVQSEAEIEIYNIAVRPDFRRFGAGQLLFNQVATDAVKVAAASIWLEVRESNNTAINFYKKNGFKEIYKRKKFYNNPVEDGIIMKKTL